MWKKFRQSGDADNLEAFKGLSDDLGHLGNEDLLLPSQKALMKANILEAIEAAESTVKLSDDQFTLAERVRAVSDGKLLSNYQKDLIYEGIMQRLNEKKFSWRDVLWAFRSWKSSVATLMIGLFALASFAVAPFELRVTRASKWTFLEDVQGEVFVNRNGRVMNVDKDFALEEGDLVFTRVGSFVTIRYLDDSVTRLGENTSLEIKKLYVRPDNAVQTQVELSLLGGYLWASVYNLIDNESSFIIETENARADVSNKAAFEIKSNSDTTVLTVFDNVVDVTKKDQSTNIQPVVAGFKAEIKDNPVHLASLPDDILIEKNSSSADQWVITNLDLDKKHQEKLKEENLEFAANSTASENTLGILADFKDTTKSLFANADIEQARQRFLEVHLGVIKAQELLDKADNNNQLRRKATPLLIQYKTAIKEIMVNFPSLYDQDPEQAEKLLAKMREEVDLQRKALSLVIPGEKLYVVKETVNEGGYYLARTSADRANYLLDRAKNRLLETQTLVGKNDLKGAEASFRTYLKGLDDLVKEVEKSQVAEIEGSLFALLDQQIKQFKALTAIESELLDKNDQRLSGLVSSVKNDSAKKLVDIVKFYRKNGIPFTTILELKNTTEQYVAKSDDKTAMLADLDGVLKSYPEYQSLPKPAETAPVEIITDQESSADLEAGDGLKVEISISSITETAYADCRESCEKKQLEPNEQKDLKRGE